MSDQLTGFVRCYCGGNNTCVCDDPYEHEHAVFVAPPYTRMSGTMADEIRAGIRPGGVVIDARAAVLEEAAKLIEKGFHIQHPAKPAGVSIGYIEGDAKRAAAIRALANQSAPP